MQMAPTKQATTIEAHRTLSKPDFADEMRPRPWIVEFSKNSERMVNAILIESRKINVCSQHHNPLLKIIFNVLRFTLNVKTRAFHFQVLFYAG